MNKSTCTIDKSGNKIWRNPKGEFHRIDGPAIECANGDKEWYFNNKLHRTDGPAIEYADDYKAWYFNGRCHRTDGPAVERANNDKEYWYKGEQIAKKKYYSKEFQVRMVMEL